MARGFVRCAISRTIKGDCSLRHARACWAISHTMEVNCIPSCACIHWGVAIFRTTEDNCALRRAGVRWVWPFLVQWRLIVASGASAGPFLA